MPHPVVYELRWGKGPTQPTTRNAKWQVYTQITSQILPAKVTTYGRLTVHCPSEGFQTPCPDELAEASKVGTCWRMDAGVLM